MNANRRFLIAASLPLCLCAAAYAAALTGYRALSGYMSMQAVLIPLLSVPLYRALLSLCLYGCILSAALSCAIWTAAALAPPLSPCLQRTWLRLILPYKIRWYFVIFRPCGFKASKAV